LLAKAITAKTVESLHNYFSDAVFDANSILPAPTFSPTPTSSSTRHTAQDCETAGNHHPNLNARYWQ